MESTSSPFGLSNTAEAIRKRKNRISLKERREDKFVNRFIQIKYPEIHAEAITAYKELVEKYPGRADVTKTYFLKKWETKNTRKEPQLYVPFLPILRDLTGNTTVEVMEEGQQQEERPQTPTTVVEEPQPQTPPQQEEGNNNSCSDMTLDEMSIAVEEIIKALQNDTEMLNIVENFDLPDDVWDNELSIPDFVLEGDLEW